MKVPCIHGFYDPHEYGGVLQCQHGPHVSHIVSCGPLFMVGGEHCPGGERPTVEQLVGEIRKRGVTISVNWMTVKRDNADTP